MRVVLLLALCLLLNTATAESRSTWRVAYSTKQHLLSHDVMNLLVKEARVESINCYLPFARRLRSLQMGQVDITAGLIKTKQREQDIYFLEPAYLNTARHYFVMRKSELRSLNQYSDLYPMRVGVKLGAKHFERFDQDPKLYKVKLNNQSECLNMLERKRVDVCLAGETGRHKALNSIKWAGKFKIAKFEVPYDSKVYIGISRQSSLYPKRAKLEHLLNYLQHSGKLSATIENYYHSQQIPVPVMTN
ncbi:ABC transporter substrate-binding protein [Agarivorans aestuarii]|uniref:ABC transporter substrate-binding protein n=1 Tax=Agarivorans aestuarii TaxID=1563703 RepID=A0ABU7G373_9ALTE|nr:ABC transporter substrate-binding protein [Agarivorans aestuarii]MEE1673793.1 ABC transporter substrate-binding protein [Agarivorans aestuarii]